MTYSNNTLINKFIVKLSHTFVLKDMGDLHYYLGVEVHLTEQCIHLTQTKYILDLLEHVDLAHIKPCPTPTITGKQLSLYNGTPMENLTIYRTVLGSLQYLTHSRPDIAYIVNKLSQFLQNLTYVHWQAI